jgi:hypothetical protein
LPAIPVPVVLAVWLSDPLVSAVFEPLPVVLADVLSLDAPAVSFLLPYEAAISPEPAELDEPWLELASLPVAPKLFAPLEEEVPSREAVEFSPAL